MAASRKQVESDGWVSLYGAGNQLGLSTKTVLARIVAGELEGKKVAGRIVVSTESVRRFLKKLAEVSAA